MPFEFISNLFTQMVNYPYLVICSLLWLTYSYVIFKGGFVSDDLQGIEQYDGTLMYPVEDENGQAKKDAQGNIIKARKLCYGTLSKWVRYHLCGGHFPSRHKTKTPDGKEGTPIPSGKIPSHHHILNLVITSVASILLFHSLLLVTTPLIALMTVSLFIVHPVCVQAIAWPSAIGYILSLICICASINIAHWTSGYNDLNHLLIGLVGLSFFQIWGVYAQGIPMFTWIILLLLGHWQLALVAMATSGMAAFINLGGYVNFRKSEFKKQNMDQSTSFNVRKPIVALKTIAYYFYLCIFPARLGLYHEWGFHYDKKVELWDWRALTGLLLVSLSVYSFVTTTDLGVRFGILWFYAFLLLFLNWITAQQWVTERYAFIPVIGLSLVACVFLQHFIPLYFLILGLYMARTLCHLPTYDNELRFYLSNTWNFPRSEVAYGNLGVTYSMVGLPGASKDMWQISTSLNPEYDVPLYNIFSKMRADGMSMIQNGDYENGLRTMHSALPVIEKVLQCKVLHFKEQWTKEYEDLKATVTNPINFLLNELSRLHTLKQQLNTMLMSAPDDKRRGEINQSIHNNDFQIRNLEATLSARNVSVEFNPERAFLSKLTRR